MAGRRGGGLGAEFEGSGATGFRPMIFRPMFFCPMIYTGDGRGFQIGRLGAPEFEWLGIRRRVAHSGQPFGLERVSVIDGVEDEFDAGRNAELVEDAEKVLLDGVLAQAEFAGGFAIAEAFCDESDDLLLA